MFQTVETIQVGNMELKTLAKELKTPAEELETPAQRERTVFDPPDGGCRAWMIVLACFILNMCNASVTMFVLMGDKGSDKSKAVLDVFAGTRKVGVVLAAICMVPMGYRLVGILGCIMYGASLLTASWIDEEPEYVTAFHVGGLAGLGSAFLTLTAIVPPLEYFATKRINAIAIVRAGEILGIIGITVLSLFPLINDDIDLDFKWQTLFRYQLIPIGVALACSATLTPLALELSNGTGYANRIVGLFDWKLFRDLVLYLILIVIFLDQFGRQLPVNHYDTLLTQVNIENDDDDLEKIIKKIVTPLIPYMGELAGLILIALCCCWKNVAVANALVFLGVVNLVAGILAYFAPGMDTLPLVAGFGALFGLSRGILNSMLDNIVPDAFGRKHVRIVEGLFGLVAGIAVIVTTPAEELIKEYVDKDSWKYAFHVGGGCVIAAGIVAILTQFKQNKHYK